MEFWRFAEPSPGAGPELVPVYSPWLILLSVAIAVFAAYVALAVVGRIRASASPAVRALWLGAGALSMGCGIWAMHFVGMLAVVLPVPVSYHLGWTLLSIVPAVAGSVGTLGLMIVRRRIWWWEIPLGGAGLAVAVGSMHYMGMEAMRANASMHYDPILFLVSIGVAWGLATVALWLDVAWTCRWEQHPGIQATVALVMGGSVAGMHYTAMAAVHFHGAGMVGRPGFDVSPALLAPAVATAVLFVASTALVGTVLDRKLRYAVDLARERDEFARVLLDSIDEGVWGIGVDGHTIFANPAAHRLLGRAPGTMEGESASAALRSPEEEPPADASAALYTLLTECRLPEERLWRADGTSFPVEYTIRPLEQGDSSVGCVMSFRDVSLRRRLELDLAAAQRLESIGQLAAGIAHEINTPTQYVSDNTHFLRQLLGQFQPFLLRCREAMTSGERVVSLDALDAAALEMSIDEAPQALDDMSGGLERIRRIVSAMKDFSHPGTEDKVPVDVNRALESTVQVSRNEWKYVADVDLDLDPDLPAVPGLHGELNQVFLNLVVNAAHAIAARERPAGTKGTIRIATRVAGDHAEIRVTDDGTGMTQAVRNRIFEPFFTTKAVGKGTGQGLSITHNVVVARHAGRIDVHTRPGEGTTFVILLPLSEPGGARLDPEPPRADAGAGAVRGREAAPLHPATATP